MERDEEILMWSGREFHSSVAGGMKEGNFDVGGMIVTRGWDTNQCWVDDIWKEIDKGW